MVATFAISVPNISAEVSERSRWFGWVKTFLESGWHKRTGCSPRSLGLFYKNTSTKSILSSGRQMNENNKRPSFLTPLGPLWPLGHILTHRSCLIRCLIVFIPRREQSTIGAFSCVNARQTAWISTNNDGQMKMVSESI